MHLSKLIVLYRVKIALYCMQNKKKNNLGDSEFPRLSTKYDKVI